MGLTQVAGMIGFSVAYAMGAGPLLATAQGGNLVGRVVDSRGAPVASVEVTLGVGSLRATTTDSGVFRMTAPAGKHRISFRRLGFTPAFDSVTVSETGVLDREFVLINTVVALDPVSVSQPLSVNMRRFEDRRRTQQGSFVSWDELKKDETKPLRSVLARKFPGVKFVGYRGALYAASARGVFEMDKRTAIHAVINDARSPVACFLQMFMDGTRLYSPDGSTDAINLNDFQTRDLEAIEFYSGNANTPPEFGSSWAGCGTLVFWTRLP